MSVNSNLFNKIELFNQSSWKKEKVSIGNSHMSEHSWMSSSVKPPEKPSPSCLLIAIAREAPGKMHLAKPSHSTELEHIIINYLKVLNLGLFVKQQEMNWNSDRCVTSFPEHQTCHISEYSLPWGLHKTEHTSNSWNDVPWARGSAIPPGSHVCSLGHLYYFDTGSYLTLYLLKVKIQLTDFTWLLYSASSRPKLVVPYSHLSYKMSGMGKQKCWGSNKNLDLASFVMSCNIPGSQVPTYENNKIVLDEHFSRIGN